MQTIAVTGGSGKLGVWLIEELLRQGFQVISLDEKRSDKLRCKQIKTDLSDFGQVIGGMHGADAVIHLAAIPAPLGFTNDYIFANNVMSTFHVLEAASMLGISKVVTSSSESSYGFCWAPKPFAPNYVPVDESHPQLPQECYGLSKVVGEQTGEMFNRRSGMQIMALRFSLIVLPEEYARLSIREPKRYKHILWSYIDIRDATDACIASLKSDVGGFHALNVTSDDTLSDWSTERLLTQFYPEISDYRADFNGREAIVSNKRAKSLLQWKPKYSWENQRDE